MCVSDFEFEMNIPAGAIWALVSAMFYAFYLVSLRRKVDHEDKMDIPMFFGKSFSHKFYIDRIQGNSCQPDECLKNG